MRNRPAIFDELSIIGFDPITAGTAHARFDMLSTSHGDGNSYTWNAGGGDRVYSIHRGPASVLEDGWLINDWTIVIAGLQAAPKTYIVDCINAVILDADGESVPFQAIHEVGRAVVDAAYETQEKDKSLRYFETGGVIIPNFNFKDPNLG